MDFQPLQLSELCANPFTLIGKEWMLVTAAKPDGSVNTMTASWGGMGVMWGKDVAFVVIRPQRYTKEFIDQSQTFSLSFLPEGYRKQLNYLGTVSGRDEDKLAHAGLTVESQAGTPYLAEARLVLLCKKLYAQPMEPGCFLDQTMDAKWYENHDYHVLYIAQIDQAMKKK